MESDKTPAEPMLRRFAFAVSDTGDDQRREKRRREVAEYVVGWLESARIIDEWEDDDQRWLSVGLSLAVRQSMARRFSVSCPWYVRGSFSPDRDI